MAVLFSEGSETKPNYNLTSRLPPKLLGHKRYPLVKVTEGVLLPSAQS